MTRTTQQLFDLTGKTALITEGASGLGLQMAHALGGAGARIMLSARKADELEAAMTELHDAGIDTRWVVADCAVVKDLERLVNETLHRMGDVDILVNNAGITRDAPAPRDPADAWDGVMVLNVRSYFLLSQLIGRQSMIGRGGRIINVACNAARNSGLGGDPAGLNTLAHQTSQGAVINFTRALASEWGPHGINVNAICPGIFACQLTANTMATLPEDHRAAALPLKRLGNEDDLKGVTLLFASDAGKYITGQWLAVDGGASAVTRA